MAFFFSTRVSLGQDLVIIHDSPHGIHKKLETADAKSHFQNVALRVISLLVCWPHDITVCLNKILD